MTSPHSPVQAEMARDRAISSWELEFIGDGEARFEDGRYRANEDLHTLDLIAAEIYRHHDQMSALYQRLNVADARDMHGRYKPHQAAEIEMETVIDERLQGCALSLLRLYYARHAETVGFPVEAVRQPMAAE